jgi:hypothetical protein
MSDDAAELARLSAAQRAAFRHVEANASARAASARKTIARIVRDTGSSEAEYDGALERVRAHARVVVHFHPDRIGNDGITVAEGLLRDGRYRSQFVTGLSSGGRTAFPGGDRDRWEEALFGGAYQAPGVTFDERPKYGALELVRYPDGPSPRFGSCYLVLRPQVSLRTTFTFAGSEQALAPERAGILERIDTVMAALLSEVAAGEGTEVPWPPFRAATLGLAGISVQELLGRLEGLSSERPEPAVGPAGRVLDSCIEAQVHGPIEVGRDVEILVADPSFVGTPAGAHLSELCRRHDVPLRRHAGFRLPVRDVPDDFRGPAMPRLARRIAGDDGAIDAAVIGAAEATLHARPEEWRDWGSRDETLQHLKQLWHVLVHYGAPAT